ncbi:MAG: long-chain fatty acid--CoA ligase [Caldilineales bacterium]|nr:long-chain fatty acid--CoA ligase [Caldilineales bacterium]MDW8319516.1 long-chain fatty acid--CoA ligase [Anaerolineae bacterium]
MHAADLLTHRARLTPSREALLELETGRRFTYADLNERACRLANFMAGLGVGPGDRVSILAHNGVVYLDLFYGLGKIGAIFTPLNWRLTAAELSYIVGDCTPTALVVGPEFAGVWAELRQRVDIPHVIRLGGAEVPGALDYDAGLAAASSAEPRRPLLDGESPYCILYTSGTTGKPKGAVLPHRQILWNCINTVASWGLSERDVSPVLTPLFHAGGLFAFMTPLFYVGGRIVLAKGFDAEQSLRVIEQERCTVILGVPTLFQMWLDASNFAQADFSAVHFFISGGAPLPVPLVEAWRSQKPVVFRQGYGLTEVGPNCFSMTDEESFRKTGSVGKPIFHSQMRLVDPATGADVPAGQTGELLIRGPHVCTGYWRNPEATAKSLVDGWFHTGDMARMDEDGFYYIVGRFKDMIISGGENVYAAEVEAVFRDHPAVQDAALIGMPDPKWGEVGLMVVVLKAGKTASEEELRQFCAGRLARYKVPKRVVFVDALPVSPYGKVMKSELRRRFVPAEDQTGPV